MSLLGLLAPTPERWLQAATEGWSEILLDHATCEKKAASSALALIFAYPEFERQNLVLARLAREELRHFEQVSRMLQRLSVPFRRLRPGRYAAGLRTSLSTREPLRRMDLMLVGAIIEARSCERFGLLAPRLPPPLRRFYADLERAEARHGELYLQFAAEAAGGHGPEELDWRSRLRELAAIEAQLINAEDSQLRFHSGPPRGSESSS